MKRRVGMWACGIVGLLVLATFAAAADTVAPAAVTFTNFRGQAEANIASENYFGGSTLIFTNCAIKSGTSATGTVQGLDGVTVDVAVGSTATNVHYTAAAISAALGTWGATVSVPTNLGIANVQVKVTDGAGSSYTYPWLYFAVKTAM